MDVYIYAGYLYCEDCGEKLQKFLIYKGEASDDPFYQQCYNSSQFPKRSFPNENSQECKGCGKQF